MNHSITLELPDTLLAAAQQEAQSEQQSLEEVLLAWLREGADLAIEALSDEDVLKIAQAELSSSDQEALSALLAKQREDQLEPTEQQQLAHLMNQYRRGLLRKAQAIKVAVERGLMPALRVSA